MTIITASAVFQQINQHFKHLGLTLPNEVAADLASIDASAINFTPANAAGVAEAALAAQTEGRDLATDEAVRTALARMLLVLHSGAITAAQESVQEEARTAALVTHGPALVETMRPVIEAAQVNITHAREVLASGRLNLDDQKMVGSLDSTRLGPWAVAREALLRVERVEQVWSLIALKAKLASVQPETRALIVADIDDLAAVSGLDNTGFGDLYRLSSPRAVVEAGLPLSLATFEQYAERVAAVNARDQEVAEQASKQRDQRFSL